MLFGAGLTAGPARADRRGAVVGHAGGTSRRVATWVLPFEALYQSALSVGHGRHRRLHALRDRPRAVRRRAEPPAPLLCRTPLRLHRRSRRRRAGGRSAAATCERGRGCTPPAGDRRARRLAKRQSAPDRDEAGADRGQLARGDQCAPPRRAAPAGRASGRDRRRGRARRGRTTARAPRGSWPPSSRCSRISATWSAGRLVVAGCARATTRRRARRGGRRRTRRSPGGRRGAAPPRGGAATCRAGRRGAARASRPRRRSERGGASRSASATGSTAPLALRVDRGHVVAGGAQGRGELAVAGADLEHAGGRGRQRGADVGDRVRRRHRRRAPRSRARRRRPRPALCHAGRAS